MRDSPRTKLPILDRRALNTELPDGRPAHSKTRWLVLSVAVVVVSGEPAPDNGMKEKVKFSVFHFCFVVAKEDLRVFKAGGKRGVK